MRSAIVFLSSFVFFLKVFSSVSAFLIRLCSCVFDRNASARSALSCAAFPDDGGAGGSAGESVFWVGDLVGLLVRGFGRAEEEECRASAAFRWETWSSRAVSGIVSEKWKGERRSVKSTSIQILSIQSRETGCFPLIAVLKGAEVVIPPGRHDLS